MVAKMRANFPRLVSSGLLVVAFSGLSVGWPAKLAWFGFGSGFGFLGWLNGLESHPRGGRARARCFIKQQLFGCVLRRIMNIIC